MTLHNYYKIVDDVKKIIYNLKLLMVMISSLNRPGVNKMSVLTLVDKTTHMLVKMFKNFKSKYKHFISNVIEKYNRIMIMIYVRTIMTYTIDERLLKNCIYMIYNDYSKYYIYNNFTDNEKKLAYSDAYVNKLFCRIIEVLSDFIKFIECKIAKYGNITKICTNDTLKKSKLDKNCNSNIFSNDKHIESSTNNFSFKETKKYKYSNITSSTLSTESSKSTTSISDFSFMEFENNNCFKTPKILEEMEFLIKHGNLNPNGNNQLSTHTTESSPEIEFDALKEQKYLIDNNIQNPNNNRKYKKACEEFTCNSTDLNKFSNSSIENNKTKHKNLLFEKTSEICDFPSDTVMTCNCSSSSHNKQNKKIQQNNSIFLTTEKCKTSKKYINNSSTCSSNCNRSFSILNVKIENELCEKYKKYVPQTKKILTSILDVLNNSKINQITKKDIYNTVMKIKNNKKMYEIFKIVSKQYNCDFDKIIKDVFKLSFSV